jgi:DNA-binding GntR family transcriptional regulator
MSALGHLLPPLNSRSPSLTDQAVGAIRDAVRAGTLVPGELYSVYRLADDLGISRSPVREALLRLAETGIVRFERNRGFRIVPPDPRDLAEIFAVRLALEIPPPAPAAASADATLSGALRAELAAMNKAVAAGSEPDFMVHDQRLHRLILDAAGNRRARDVIENLRDAIRLVAASTIGTSRTLDEVHAEHTPIVDSIEAGDPGAAADAMKQHLIRTGRLLLQAAVQAEGRTTDADHLWDHFVS